MKGFFTKSELLSQGKKPPNLAPRCELCRLYKGCVSPKMPVTGQGDRKVLIVAEAPGAKEDERNEQLIGKAGQRLRDTLSQIDVDLDQDCWKTNAIICRPPNNRTPTPQELEYCRPHLVETIDKLKPNVIVVLGDSALRQMIEPYWHQDVGPLERWVGAQIPLQPLNIWICPSWHPSYLEREKNDVRQLWFLKHLTAAFKLQTRPWEEVPDYKSKVERLNEVQSVFNDMAGFTGMAALDYETNMLKPDDSRSVIVSASVTWGKSKVERCVAFPMNSSNKEAFRNFLRSPIPKIAANLKFEERWSLRHFKTRVRNWCWDTMQCAHVMDNRKGITSLDYQAFTRLGLPEYSTHIKPMLKGSKQDSSVNQVLTEISMPQLLLYNGLDTITEFEIAVKQMKELHRSPPWKDKSE